MDDRRQRYQNLVGARKVCRLCSNWGLINASEVRGELDSEQIGPWSGWLGDLNARVMVVGQDWGDQGNFEDQRGHNWPDSTTTRMSATNRTLLELLAEAGIVPKVGPGESSGVFLTNAVLCFRRQGGASGPVQSRWFQNCGTSFLRPQIELVNPRVVICLGKCAYEAVLATYGLPRNWPAAVNGAGTALTMGGPVAFAVYHCSQVCLNTHRKKPDQLKDWKRIGEAMARMSAAPALEGGIMMSPEDTELVEFLDSVSFTDDKDKDWKDRPDLGLDPDDDADEDDEEDDELG
ncbi:MAG: uracil-DNA glycosylase family protein [Acidobacteriota bacterium]|nr:uracil-DNA glycosylase family protein [Acidobacteriota bacterium]